MKIVKKTERSILFETKSGCRFTRPVHPPTGMAVDLDGWEETRLLLEPDQLDRDEFPEVQWRLEITPALDQDHPFFQSTPCWLEPGSKDQLIYVATNGDEEVATVIQWWEGKPLIASPQD